MLSTTCNFQQGTFYFIYDIQEIDRQTDRQIQNKTRVKTKIESIDHVTQ